MKSLFCAALLIAGASLVSVSTARADTYSSYHCQCVPASGEKQCTCTNSYTLGKSETHEFRIYCDVSNFAQPSINISGRKGGTSCTIKSAGFPDDDYTTQSCTNWDPFSTDGVTITGTCYTANPTP